MINLGKMFTIKIIVNIHDIKNYLLKSARNTTILKGKYSKYEVTRK